MSLWRRMLGWARRVKRDVLALYLAARHSRVPWYTKVLAACVAAYALSPIDLIPDFVPVLGYLDDLLILPAGIWLTVRLIPADLLHELRAKAETMRGNRPVSWAAAAAIVALWIAAGLGVAWWIARRV